jgi:DNA-binding PadR family transcriptional regulator
VAKVKLEHILLGVLLHHPQTGYELQRFMETTGRFMRSNTSMTQVYRSLRKMEADGWLTFDVEPRFGAQDAKRHRVTPDGETMFFAWLAQPYEPPELPGDPDFFTHLRFRASYLSREAAIELLDTELAFRRRQIARNRDRDRTEWYVAGAPIDVELSGALMNWEHHRGVARMDLHVAACAELREVLAAGGLPNADEPSPLQPAEPPDQSGSGAREVS